MEDQSFRKTPLYTYVCRAVLVVLALPGLILPLSTSNNNQVDPLAELRQANPDIGHYESMTVEQAMAVNAETYNPFPQKEWCGNVSSEDLKINSIDEYAPKFKFIYAYASDQPNRLYEWAPQIQRAAEQAAAHVKHASKGTRTLRYDMGTKCGAQYLDIQTVRLPKALEQYRNGAAYFIEI